MNEPEDVWWGCRRCKFAVHKDDWKPHSNCHSLVEAAQRMKFSIDRALGQSVAPYICGICVQRFDGPDELMEHLEGAHFAIRKQDRDKQRFSI